MFIQNLPTSIQAIEVDVVGIGQTTLIAAVPEGSVSLDDLECSQISFDSISLPNSVTTGGTQASLTVTFTGLRLNCKTWVQAKQLRVNGVPGSYDASFNIETVLGSQTLGSNITFTIDFMQPAGLDNKLPNELRIPSAKCYFDLQLGLVVADMSVGAGKCCIEGWFWFLFCLVIIVS